VTRLRTAAAASLPLLLSACDGVQSAMGGDGVQGAHFVTLLRIFLLVCGFFYILVMGFLIMAMIRGARAQGEGERAIRPVFFGWVALTAVALIGLTFASYLTDRAFAADGAGGRAVKVQVTANQWWWDVQYEGATPSERVRTANELHLPIGRPAIVTLHSNDVIHSFWLPNLAGKQDLIPGRDVDIALLPTKVGLFRGQCAEFCGAQHAHMALDVTAESEVAFEAWRRRQLAPGAKPRTSLALTGYNYVTGRECAICHAIAGTPASAQVAPDLTHIASRRSIGAGTFPMTRGHLYAWIADPQGAKPGNHMPIIGLEPGELDAVVAYLEGLR
jgi:cytochrome c oxidase subunit 2